MDFSLRPLEEGDAGLLQQLYEAGPDAFRRLLGRPAAAGQAARDIAQARATPGRYQSGAVLDGRLVGMIDLKLSDEVAGQADIGLLLFPGLREAGEIAALALRILTRWLRDAMSVCRIEAGVPAADAAQIAFWQAQGFAFTGQSYRRELEQFAPRFLVLARDLSADGKEAASG